jgi:cytochrome c oxidase assembly protein subunit 15
MSRAMRLPTISSERYRRLADVSLALLALIVLTGAAVRLTGSGLGCPDWPKCHGGVIPPADTHAWTEFGNRLLSGVVGFVVAAVSLLAWRRRPFSRRLAWVGTLLPLGVLAQAVLGGFTVRNHLAPGFVMGHFGLSMVILVAAVALSWLARYEPGERPRTLDARLVWAVRGLLAWATVVLAAGAVTTASGPHAGSAGTGEIVPRLEFFGVDTLDHMIHWHGRSGTILGLGCLAVFFWLRRQGAARELVTSVGAACVLVGAQGVVGGVQYLLHLPAELVWLHVAIATATWLTLLWSVGLAGSPAPRRQAGVREPQKALAAR